MFWSFVLLSLVFVLLSLVFCRCCILSIFVFVMTLSLVSLFSINGFESKFGIYFVSLFGINNMHICGFHVVLCTLVVFWLSLFLL